MTPRGPLRSECEGVFRAALRRLSARRLVAEALAADPLPSGPIRVLALGKAAAPMLDAAVATLGDRVLDPMCVLPDGAAPPTSPGARVHPAGHPRPTPASLGAGQAILAWADANGETPALVLLSGGGSALAVAPAEPVLGNAFTFAEKVAALELVMRAGATIGDLNAVRKHLSALKGGRLGWRLAPAPVRVLVMSDVPGDDLSTIASGPFVPDPTTWGDVFRVFQETGTWERIPVAVQEYAMQASDMDEETPEPDHPRFDTISHRLLAGPVHLARAAAEEATARGFAAEADGAPLTGDVADVARRVGAWARANAGRGRRLLALGGEPTVRVPAASAPDGGRAQHLALLAARELAGLPAAVLAAGSDGRDGPTEQAGAVVDGDTVRAAAAAGVDLEGALRDARSGPACVAIGVAIPRFETGTHLCDLVVVAVE